MKIKLVDDFKDCWKWISIHCLVVVSLLSAFSSEIMEQWNELPPEWQNILLHYYSNPVIFRIISFISIIGIFGRLMKQKKKC